MSASQLSDAQRHSSHPSDPSRGVAEGSGALRAAAAVALLLGGCAHRHAEPTLDWLPDATGWTVRDVDPDESPTWVAYDRDAHGADVKEIRIVGLVDAAPQVTMKALRHRLVAQEYMPKGMTSEVLQASDDELLTYSLAPLPWPFRDRDVTERMVFTDNADAGVFRVDVSAVDTDREVPRGVVRVPVVRNSFVVTPTESGTSVLTSSSVHDMGGAFPNRVIYGPVSDGMVDLLVTVREIAVSFERVASVEAVAVASHVEPLTASPAHVHSTSPRRGRTVR